MNTHKAFILGVALLSTIGVKAQFAIDDYKAVFTSSPQQCSHYQNSGCSL